MTTKLRLLSTLFILITCVGCDQVAKAVARETLALQPPISLFGGLLRLQYSENQGAFLNLGAALPETIRWLLLVVVVTAILAAILVYTLRSPVLNTAQWLGLSLVAGGGLGNLADRLFRDGMVVDYAILGVGPLHTGIFNLADVALMAGIALIALSGLGGGNQPDAG